MSGWGGGTIFWLQGLNLPAWKISSNQINNITTWSWKKLYQSTVMRQYNLVLAHHWAHSKYLMNEQIKPH